MVKGRKECTSQRSHDEKIVIPPSNVVSIDPEIKIEYVAEGCQPPGFSLLASTIDMYQIILPG